MVAYANRELNRLKRPGAPSPGVPVELVFERFRIRLDVNAKSPAEMLVSGDHQVRTGQDLNLPLEAPLRGAGQNRS